MSHPKSQTSTHVVDQYHHVVPRFILREFQIGPKKTKRERKQEFRKFRFVNERIWFYDIESGTLESRLIAKAFGVTNLYRDVRNIENVNELETKLSELENTAARLLNALHSGLESNDRQPIFTTVRQDLEQLRKFLFVMHYRNEALALSYFSTEHPENAPIRNRIIKMTQKLDLHSPMDTWLHFLRYYLDTPHMQITVDAMKGAPITGDPMKMFQFFAKADTMAENFEAVTYQLQAGFYYMGIVQAAPGEEFVLTNNSFGLWEGHLMGQPGLHRLYIMSPRIAIILRVNLLRSEETGGASKTLLPFCFSDLLDINLPIPISKPLNGESLNSILQQKLDARLDKFTFRITCLTKKQTNTINSIVLLNGRPSGYLTFASPQCMRSTVRQFWKDKMIGVSEERYKYESLIRQLSYTSPILNGDLPADSKPVTAPIRLRAPLTDMVEAMSLGPASQEKKPQSGKNLSFGASTSKIHGDFKANKIESQASSSARKIGPEMSSKSSNPKPGERKSAEEEALDDAIMEQLLRLAGPPNSPAAHFKSMHALWQRFSAITPQSNLYQHVFIVSYRQMLSLVTTRLERILKDPSPSFKPHQNAELVGSLTDKDAIVFHFAMKNMIKTLGVAQVDGDPPSLKKHFALLVQNVVIMGMASWIARSRHDCLDVILGGVRIVQNARV